ncbi:uncharacterized protein LOC121871610 [Homarus americanus]|uniref:uncharacterized protein LOC121871610 n=1 Tax=Homarus americanus TaxID=6706 RepID=UPI001C481F35|nr:uncharacterized protein LOC121871610 [Homarus americanus]
MGGKAPQPPPPAASAISSSRNAPVTSTPTSSRRTAGHLAFRGFKLGQRVSKGVGDGISRLGQAVGSGGRGAAGENKPEGVVETQPEVTRSRKLDLERIGVKLSGLTSRDAATPAGAASEVGPGGTSSLSVTPVTDDDRTITRSWGEEGVGASCRREMPYRKLAKLLGKEPASPPPQTDLPAHALFLREAPRGKVGSVKMTYTREGYSGKRPASSGDNPGFSSAKRQRVEAPLLSVSWSQVTKVLEVDDCCSFNVFEGKVALDNSTFHDVIIKEADHMNNKAMLMAECETLKKLSGAGGAPRVYGVTSDSPFALLLHITPGQGLDRYMLNH